MPFNRIQGQERAKRILQNGLRDNKLSHAYIFSGPSGTGREEMAMVLAQAVYCTVLQDDACGECLECRKVEHGNHPDLHVLSPDGASIKIEQVRDLQKEFAYRATASAKKIYIVHDADKMTIQAANSLLKFLEEPTSEVIAVLLTENGQALLPTIRSRAQEIQFLPMNRERMIQALLDEGHPAPLVRAAAQLTAGIDAARNMIQGIPFAELRNVVIQLAKETLTRFPATFLTVQQKLMKTELSEHIPLFFDLLILWFRDMANIRLGRKEGRVYNDQLDWMNPQAISRDVEYWLKGMEQAMEMQKRLRYHANPQLILEKWLIELQGV